MYRFPLFHIIIIASTIVVTASCSREGKQLMVSNTANIGRLDDLIILKRQEIEHHIGVIPTGKYALVLKDGVVVAAQYDDMDGDGDWDELAMLLSFKANEKIKLSFSIADESAMKNITTRAHVVHRKIKYGRPSPPILKDTMSFQIFSDNPAITSPFVYQNEGPAWENDKCAFRLHFDSRNSKDIIAKHSPGMIIDTTVPDPATNILRVANSLGAGSIAIAAKATNGIDTLIRLGGINIKRETYEVLANGPLRAAFRIKYDWEINGRPVQIVDETSIWGGQYFYETKLKIEGTPPFAQAVAGFADFGDHVAGHINIAGSKIFYSYGGQSQNKDSLGLAIAIDGANYGWFSGITDSLSDIQHSYLVSQKFVPGEVIQYRFYSCWGKTDGQFKTEEGFEDYLKKQAVLMHDRLVMEWK